MPETEIEIAEAQAQADAAPRYRSRKSASTEVAARGELGDLGLEPVEAKLEEGFVDPTVVQILYHRFDGRTVIVPAYMSPKLLAQRVPPGAPAQYVGQPAWSTSPTNNYVPGQVKCLLHEDQDKAILNELKTIGLTSGRCKKANIHTPYDLEIHMGLKHKREWAAIKSAREKVESDANRMATQAQAEALIKMAEAISASQK